MFAIGTEIHLVNRMARRFAAEGKRIITLDDTGCLCTTMYRITPQHLAWALENLVEGRVVNRIQVRDEREALGARGAGPDAGNREQAVGNRRPVFCFLVRVPVFYSLERNTARTRQPAKSRSDANLRNTK